ncbi:hypothetical protein BGX38DRAFT_1190531 [Terfezia claveryi]|nr:hypothetical protein BGX38DRAFT_1190531 [Terfezia claveryi]
MPSKTNPSHCSFFISKIAIHISPRSRSKYYNSHIFHHRHSLCCSTIYIYTLVTYRQPLQRFFSSKRAIL